jgi:hypothetical protein
MYSGARGEGVAWTLPLRLEVARLFVEDWIGHFNAADWAFLLSNVHTGGRDNHSYFQGLRDAGFKATRFAIRAFSYPNWSVFRDSRLFPKPEFWVDVFLETPAGNKNSLYLALAPHESSYRTCYYVGAKTKPVRKLDLQLEHDQILKFLTTAGTAIAKLRNSPLEFVELQFSSEHGIVHLGLDTQTSESGRILTQPEFRSLKRWNWAGFMEMGETLIDRSGAVLARNETNRETWGITGATLDTLIGNMLVNAIKQHRDSGLMASWNLSSTAQFGVSELEGAFGFPQDEKRGNDNWLIGLSSPT